MHRAGAYPFSNQVVNREAESYYDRYLTFDRDGSFELRYARYRRYGDGREPLPYLGYEFDRGAPNR
jgi:hypothetical protein